jgi:hypothetical protein
MGKRGQTGFVEGVGHDHNSLAAAPNLCILAACTASGRRVRCPPYD